MDRVYLSCPNAIAVIDHGKKRTFVIRKEGLPDVGKIHKHRSCLYYVVHVLSIYSSLILDLFMFCDVFYLFPNIYSCMESMG